MRQTTSSPGREHTSGHDAGAQLVHELRTMHAGTGKTLKELESELHVSDSSLSRYLSGQAVAPWSVVAGLCLLTGRRPESLRPLWEQAHRWRRPAAPAEPTQDPPDDPPEPEPPARRRRPSRRVLLGLAFLVTATVFGTAGLLVGRQLTSPLVLKPTEDQACAAWPWPADTGAALVPPVQPQANDHTPTVELLSGKASDGQRAVWAEITGARFGDRVWLDWSANQGRSWIQCGPFPVTTDSGTSRAHDLTPGSLFRACGDIPSALAVPGRRSEICTVYH
jgi:hypothetical protein